VCSPISESLEEAGIKSVPSTITYEKKSESEYEFCMTYKEASKTSGLGITSSLSGEALTQLSQKSDTELNYYDSYQPSSLYISYEHKKGKNCQTVVPYGTGSYDYNSYYQDSFGGGTDTSGITRDIERSTDIKALHGQIEAYYAQNGRYPTLANMNDSTWRTANMKGLDQSALRDPKGSSATLVNSPAENAYSYEPSDVSGGACDNVNKDCVAYTLTATLETGGTYSKTNLN